MTIIFNRNSGTFTLAHSGNTRVIDESHLSRLARAQEWGDVEAHLEAAKQNPGVPVSVDNHSRVFSPRYSRVYAVQQ